MGEKSECIGCKNYYIYYSKKDCNYVITEHALEAFDNSPWIGLEDRCVPDLIKLLQKHESVLEKNKVNLSAKVEEQTPIKERSYLRKLLDIARATSNKD